jgi:hypothetical protein
MKDKIVEQVKRYSNTDAEIIAQDIMALIRGAVPEKQYQIAPIPAIDLHRDEPMFSVRDFQNGWNAGYFAAIDTINTNLGVEDE